MLESLQSLGSASLFIARDVLDMLSSSPRTQLLFVKELSDNFVHRVMDWPYGLIPRNFTEHEISEMLIEQGLALVTLPITGPVCLPALVTSFVLGKVTPDKR